MKQKEIPKKKLSEEVQFTGVTSDERHHLIAVAAYYRAELRGFESGAELQDWLEAEAEVDKALNDTAADSA
jgi:hypothetical protein